MPMELDPGQSQQMRFLRVLGSMWSISIHFIHVIRRFMGPPWPAWSRLIANATFGAGLEWHAAQHWGPMVWPTPEAAERFTCGLSRVRSLSWMFPAMFGCVAVKKSAKRLEKTNFNVFTSNWKKHWVCSLRSCETTCSIFYPHVSCKACKLKQSRPRGEVRHSPISAPKSFIHFMHSVTLTLQFQHPSCLESSWRKGMQ